MWARQSGISPSQLFAWKHRMLEGGHAAVPADEDVVSTSQVRDLERRVRDLECMPGKKAMEADILKEVLDLARPKKRTSPLPSWSNPEGDTRRAPLPAP
jgi:transposase